MLCCNKTLFRHQSAQFRGQISKIFPGGAQLISKQNIHPCKNVYKFKLNYVELYVFMNINIIRNMYLFKCVCIYMYIYILYLAEGVRGGVCVAPFTNLAGVPPTPPPPSPFCLTSSR